MSTPEAAATGQRCIALDIGGSSIKSAIVSAGGCGTIAATPIDSCADRETVVATIASAVERHLGRRDDDDGVGAELAGPARQGRLGPSARASAHCLGVAAGCPGPFDYRAGISWIRGVGKYEALYGVDLGASLRRQLALPELPIVWRNDAEAAIAGEARHGAGSRYRRLIGITLGTGIGSAFMVDGVAVIEGPGVPADGWLYPEPWRGAQADEVFGSRGLLARLRLADPDCVSVAAGAETARAGHARTAQAFHEYGAELGRFMERFVLGFEARAVLVLGGIAGAWDVWGASMQRRLPVAVLPGRLGAAAPLLGAADLLFDGSFR